MKTVSKYLILGSVVILGACTYDNHPYHHEHMNPRPSYSSTCSGPWEGCYHKAMVKCGDAGYGAYDVIDKVNNWNGHELTYTCARK